MTAHEIRKAIEVLFPSPAHTVLSEVRNGTGFAKSVRTADMVIASTWPSRGLWLAGVEIKVYLGDWKRELAQPEKAEAIQQYCHFWYVAAPEGLIPTGQLPVTWGLIEVGKKAKVTVKPPFQEPKPMDMLFVGSLLRNFAESYVPKSDVDELAKAKASKLEEHRSQELAGLKQSIEEFVKASGVDLNSQWEYGNIGKAVKLVIESGILHRCDRLQALRAQAAGVVECCDKIFDSLKGNAPEIVD